MIIAGATGLETRNQEGAGSGGRRQDEAGRRRARFVKQRDEVARRPTGRPARHVAEGVESELSRNPTLYVGPGAAVWSALLPGRGLLTHRLLGSGSA